ncbi:MAG: GGDEF domain-containing protein [Fimbriimonadales bacterium]|nr:GGDEF domain-containing protein [Fimbriimonadales bacterium]MDW8051763.1 GGDEF domain-containing protein [Armatimonadota bacterium]
MGKFWLWLQRLLECDATFEQALLADLLRLWGDYAFETQHASQEANRQTYHQLSQQVRTGNYDKVLPIAREQRIAEQQFVVEYLNDIREATWQLLDTVARFVQAEAEGNTEMRHKVQLLNQQTQDATHLDVPAIRQAIHTIIQLLEQREQRYQQMLQEMQSRVQYLMRELEQARRESTIDALTGLYNRRAFDACLESTVVFSRLFHYPATLLLIDVDNFKQVNDTYGHAAGDAVLKAVAERIVRVCKRRSDFVARYGGEEFAVILRETALHDAQKIAHQILEQIRNAPVALENGVSIPLTVSIGVSELQLGESAQQWLQRADAQLYQAKRGGRNRIAA